MARILVIEDEISLLEEILTILNFENFEAKGASDGDMGIRLAREFEPDLIISDIMMPGLDGYEVLRELQDETVTSKIPFIFLTAKSDRTQLRYGMELGADDYIPKPFTRDELLSAIHTRLAKQSVVRQNYEQKLEDLRQSIVLALPHELRTPLTSLVGFAELLMMDAEVADTSQIETMADAIYTAGKRLQRQIQNFLLYAQLDLIQFDQDGIDQLRRDRLSEPGNVIEEAAWQVAAGRSREPDLVVQTSNASVEISESHLQKIVQELVDNAFKFSSPGARVQVAGSSDTSVYIFSVRDQGRGMTPEQIRNAGAYVQFDRRLYEQQGTGLGLSIVSRLVELLGGTLTIQGIPQQGTEIVVRLPLDQ